MYQNEAHIIKSFASGDVAAFRIIYERYYQALRYFATGYLGEAGGAEDVVQDCFVRLWEKRTDFLEGDRNEKVVRFYLYQSVRNACLNILRHDKMKQKHTEAYVDKAGREESFVEKFLEAELMQLFLNAVEELSPAVREVYKLTMDGLNREEIGEKLNITVNTVKKHRASANEFLRERLRNMLSVLLMLIP